MRRNTTLMTLAAMALCASPPAEPVGAAPGPEADADSAPEYPNRQQRRQAERMAKKGRAQ